MNRSNSNPTTSLTKRRSFRGWLKRVTVPNGATRRVAPDNYPKGGVFGIRLTMSIKYANTSVGYIDENNVKHTQAGRIPIVVGKCGSYLKKNALETEGIFRVSGSVKRVNALEFQFDQSASHYGFSVDWEGYTVHDVASLLRRYLNKLPEPVIPFEYYQQFRDVMSNNSYKTTDQRVEAFQHLIRSLSPPHQHLLLYLLDTLSIFAIHADETKMDISNLAAVFCPGILRHPDHNTPVQYKISQYVIEFLIEFQNLFPLQFFAPSKRKHTNSSEVPPVPLLLPSSVNQLSQPPQVPLHVINPSESIMSSSSKSSIGNSLENNSSFIESPQDINQATSSPTAERTVLPNQPTTGQSFVQGNKKVATDLYQAALKSLTQFRHTIEPYVAKPAALLMCISVLLVTLVVIVYEAYLAVTLVSFEPLIFFSGLISYWGLLYHSLPDSTSTDKKEQEDIVPEMKAINDEPVENDDTAETSYPMMDSATEKEMMQDETIMSEWRDLLTRSWKLNEVGEKVEPSSASIFAADDNASMISKSSRFDEEEDALQPTGSISSSDDDEDEELGFDPDTLEMYLSQYDQIKKDAQLAKQLQYEEQRARDENNPFLAENITVSKKPPAINTTPIDRSLEKKRIVTPTSPNSAEREEWKIRVFPRQ